MIGLLWLLCGVIGIVDLIGFVVWLGVLVV